ncbi:MAG: hypothetical protein U1F35_18690 [Steroidobacteraceae bacterium]
MTGISLLLPITLTTMAIVLLAPVVPKMMDAFAGEPNREYLVPMVLTMPALCVAILCPFGWLESLIGDPLSQELVVERRNHRDPDLVRTGLQICADPRLNVNGLMAILAEAFTATTAEPPTCSIASSARRVVRGEPCSSW